MRGQRFDRYVKSLATSTDRRGVVGGFVASVVGLGVVALGKSTTVAPNGCAAACVNRHGAPCAHGRQTCKERSRSHVACEFGLSPGTASKPEWGAEDGEALEDFWNPGADWAFAEGGVIGGRSMAVGGEIPLDRYDYASCTGAWPFGGLWSGCTVRQWQERGYWRTPLHGKGLSRVGTDGSHLYCCKSSRAPRNPFVSVLPRRLRDRQSQNR